MEDADYLRDDVSKLHFFIDIVCKNRKCYIPNESLFLSLDYFNIDLNN
jgi:hypothetical protein